MWSELNASRDSRDPLLRGSDACLDRDDIMKIAVFDDPDQSRQNYIETAAVVFAVPVYQVRRGISQYVAYHLIVAVAE